MKYSIELTPAQYKRTLKLLQEATVTSILNKKPTVTIKANKALVDKFNNEFKKEKTND